MTGNSESPTATTRRVRRPGTNWRILVAIAVALAVVLAGYGAYRYFQSPAAKHQTVLIVYSYPSLFFGSNCNSPVFDSVFGAFGRAHGVTVQVECPPGTLVSTLLAQKNAPGADLVLGLDEITAPEADAAGLLVPYASPQLAHISGPLVSEIGADHAVTPYESGFLSIDFNASFYATTRGEVAHSSFANFSQNLSWARSLMLENPTTDITGDEFLVWQIEFYTTVLHQDWTVWWKAVDHYVRAVSDWSTAFADFSSGGPSAPSLVVSYLSDPAYAVSAGTPGAYNSTVTTWNGLEYGWRSVYGIGIVQGSAHLALDRQFIDWFLGGAVQSQIPTTEWEIPANETIPLPAVYSAMPSAADVTALNDRTSPNATAQNLTGWLNTWQAIANQFG